MSIMKEPAEIGHTGEKCVEVDLQRRGYSTYRNTWQPGKVDIFAVNFGKNERLLVQVKSSSNGKPAGLDLVEIDQITKRAQDEGSKPVAAYVDFGGLQPIRYQLLVPNGLLSFGWQP